VISDQISDRISLSENGWTDNYYLCAEWFENEPTPILSPSH
jgi:hypothetical protein